MGLGWKPRSLNEEEVQNRRKETNDQANKTRQAVNRDLRIGDQVLICDRQLGWTFRTPYKRGMWTITEVKGTMITAQKGQEKEQEPNPQKLLSDMDHYHDSEAHQRRKRQKYQLKPNPAPSQRLHDFVCDQLELFPTI
ncbi:hypothetical protein NDU88_002585 [Pleurodeles waltl]|uniref:Uncharacterized protein n=1 Tax=Pleurodeles waltl TaxID=8319 RepID=A0AAV7SD25_PLEWA|nr:hypothetical protein NDU88_002585 [Pleurodeles waltl]